MIFNVNLRVGGMNYIFQNLILTRELIRLAIIKIISYWIDRINNKERFARMNSNQKIVSQIEKIINLNSRVFKYFEIAKY